MVALRNLPLLLLTMFLGPHKYAALLQLVTVANVVRDAGTRGGGGMVVPVTLCKRGQET